MTQSHATLNQNLTSRRSGIGYNFMDNVVHVRRAVKHFNLSKFSLIGHSMGGGICSAFAATHPELVEHLVSLDMICPLLRPLDDQVRIISLNF